MNQKLLKAALVTLGLLSFSQTSFSNESFLSGWKNYIHIEQAETKYTENEVDNDNPGQPFTRVQLSLSKNFQFFDKTSWLGLGQGSWLGQYDVSYEGYPMQIQSNAATGHIFSNKFNLQKNSDFLNVGAFVNYSQYRDRGDDENKKNSFLYYGIQANKFIDHTKTRVGLSYGKVRGDDYYGEGIATNKPGNNYNFYVQQYLLNDNLRVGYALNLLDGRRDNADSENDRATVSSHLLNAEYYFSEKYPVALTASYEIINYRPGASESDQPDAKEFKLGFKYIFGGEKTLMAFDKARISYQPNVENYWAHLANEIQ
jgi:hypothetical protein